jgi:hypothetical protein
MIYHRFERFTYYKPPAMPEVVDWHQLGQDTKLKGGVIWRSAFIFVQADYDSQL